MGGVGEERGTGVDASGGIQASTQHSQMRHGFSDACESLLMAVPRVHVDHHVGHQNRLPNGPSCAYSTASGQIHGQGR